MEYPIALGILALYFLLVGFLGTRKKGDHEPPPKGGVQAENREHVEKLTFREFHARAARKRGVVVTAQRRSA